MGSDKWGAKHEAAKFYCGWGEYERSTDSVREQDG